MFLTSISFISPELEIKFWKFNEYLDPLSAGPSALIPISLVRSQACRVAVYKYPKRHNAEESDAEGELAGMPVGRAIKVWATVGVTRVSSLDFYVETLAYDVHHYSLQDAIVI